MSPQLLKKAEQPAISSPLRIYDNFFIFYVFITFYLEKLLASRITWILLHVNICLHDIVRDSEDVPMVARSGILAEPRLAIPYITAVFHLEADQVLTAVHLAAELPSKVVEQTTQFDVGTTLEGGDVVRPVGVAGCRAFGYSIFIVAILIDSAALEVS